MSDKIKLELTRGEIIMLQELTDDIDCSYEWQQQMADGINRKLHEAYQKPKMNAGMYNATLEAERALWAGEPVETHMVRAKEHEVRFFYDVEDIE